MVASLDIQERFFKTNKISSNRFAVIGLVVLFVALIGCVIAIVILAVRLDDEMSENSSEDANTGEDTMDMSNCDDIAIIGAGVSGTYSAWRLRDRNLKMSLYEYSNRIGGRCFTVQLPGIPDVNVEMGAMRFRPDEHELVNKTANDLGLEVIDFALGFGSSGETLYYLRGQHMASSELATKAPFDIPQEYRIDRNTLRWQIFNNFTISANGDVLKSLDGVDLYKQSHDVFYAKYLDTETARYLTQSSNFISTSGTVVTAATYIPVNDPSLSGPPKAVKTVKEGFQAIPESLVEQFLNASDRHSFYRNHHLKSIKKHGSGKYILTFHPTETIAGITTEKTSASAIKTCAEKVILGIPRIALERLDWEALKQDPIQDYIMNSVTETKAGKMYFGYDSAWWRNLALATVYAVSMTPLRQTYDYAQSESTTKGVLNPGYPDKGTELWREALGSGELVPGVGDNSIAMTNTSVYLARKYYAEVFNVTLADVPEPNSAVMSVWDQYPIAASWYEWAPGYDWAEVESAMIKPSTNDDIYIAANVFSSNRRSGWIQGAMEMVEKMIDRYFKVAM